MRFIYTLVLLLSVSTSFGQWTRVTQLPASDIYTLYRDDSILYAGGNRIIYTSKDKGRSWDSTAIIPSFTLVNAIIIYKNELYAGSYGHGIYKSLNGGQSWQNISDGFFPYISEFSEWQGNLYASSLGGGIFKLDATSRNRWISFNNNLSSLSANINSLAGNDHALIAGTLANGIIDRLSDNSINWNEQYILNHLDPGDGVFDIIASHDSLFIAGYRSCYLSTDNGVTWNRIGDQLHSTYINLLNAKQALLIARNTFNGATNNTNFYYLMKNSMQTSFVPFSSVVDHFSYRMEILGDKLWDASSHGLYYMALSDLPGITPADEKDTTVTNNPGAPAGPGEPNVPNVPVDPATYPFSIGKIFPNPVSDEGHVSLSFNTGKTVSVYLYDISGKLISVITDHRQMVAGSTILSFRMTNLNSGIYFLRLYIDNQVFVKEILHTN
jgi:hypothetical protein